MNRERAVRFILNHGSMADKARLFFLESQTPPEVGLVDQLQNTQRENGGWQPLWAEDYSSIEATCVMLERAMSLGMKAETPFFKDGLDFLVSRQAPDGSWEESPQVKEVAPPWVKPGDSSSRLYLTAHAGWTLACSLGGINAVEKAAQYLQNVQSVDGSLPSYLQTVWLAAGIWQILEQKDPLRRAILFLQMRAGRMPANFLSWMLVTLLQSGFDPDSALIQNALERLDGLQHADGHWDSDDGSAYDVHITLQSLQAFAMAGNSAGQSSA